MSAASAHDEIPTRTRVAIAPSLTGGIGTQPSGEVKNLSENRTIDGLTIRGERRAEAVPDNRYHRRERQVGPFPRTIRLGERFDPDRVEAVYRDGVLRLSLARTPEATTRRITIQS